jgi:hypothetical protein
MAHLWHLVGSAQFLDALVRVRTDPLLRSRWGLSGRSHLRGNYALYTTAIAATVLIALDLPHASGFAVESRRILFTLAGVAIGVAVMLLANLMKEHAAKASGAQPATT